MEFLIEYQLYIMLFGLAILSSFVDALAGGGGLLSIPALMMTGMPPLSVLGTNKLQASMGGQIIGAWLGSHYLFKINPTYLRLLIVSMSLLMLAKYLWSI